MANDGIVAKNGLAMDGGRVLKSKNPYLRYGLALLVAALALLLRQALDPLLGSNNPFHTLWLAVVFSAWYCGVGPAIVTTLAGMAGVAYWFMAPYHSFAVSDRDQIFGLIGFLIFSAIIITISEVNRRNFMRCQTAEYELRSVKSDLEKRVSERTEELLGANDNLRELSARLLRLRDEEHRRIARELHDSVGQLLAAINMNTGVVKRELDSLSPNAQALLHENSQMIDEVIRQIRTLSYLLHPPQLDESGLPSALQWFVDGFAKRSEIQVKLEIAEDFPRLTEEAETSIFRTVQECLTNIHRHSGSSTAEICLQRKDGKLEIEVRDKGKGISGHRQKAIGAPGPIGVGVRGMRERWRQLGGSLEILSNGNGTIVKASIPEPKAEAAAANVGTP